MRRGMMVAEEDNRRQWLILQTALAQGDEQVALWEQWRSLCPDLEGLHPLEMRLLPWIWRRLTTDSGVAICDRRIRGLYKKAWYGTRRLVSEAVRAQEELAAEGIASLLFKGCALALTAYRDPGARPCADADLLVHPGEFRRAVRILSRTRKPTDGASHAVHLRNGSGTGIDLHRVPSRFSLIRGVKSSQTAAEFESLLSRSTTSPAAGAKACMPTLNDLLFIQLLNAFCHAPPGSLSIAYWVLDAAVCLRESDFNTEEMQRRIDDTACHALLAEHFEPFLPLVPAALRAMRTTSKATRSPGCRVGSTGRRSDVEQCVINRSWFLARFNRRVRPGLWAKAGFLCSQAAFHGRRMLAEPRLVPEYLHGIPALIRKGMALIRL